MAEVRKERVNENIALYKRAGGQLFTSRVRSQTTEITKQSLRQGWKDSEGAKIEHNHARALGKEIKYQNPEEIA